MSATTAATRQSEFFLVLLASLRDVLGDRAAAALVQYAAAEAATREARERPAEEGRALAPALDRLGETLATRFRVVESSLDRVVVEATGSAAERDDPVSRALLAGAVKGACVARGAPAASSVDVAASANAVRIVVRRLAHVAG